jgi:hypothetical protein
MNGDDNDQLLVPAPSAWFDDDALPNTAAQSPLDSFIDNITSNRCDNSSKKTNQPPQGAASSSSGTIVERNIFGIIAIGSTRVTLVILAKNLL